MMVSGCAATNWSLVPSETAAVDLDSRERPRHYAELMEEAAAETPTPRTCTIKGNMVNCF